ncbi:hypothetical protein MVEN_00353000 [Mycena venus]|uniref:Uncharacterized protein n=1 Tax=Mycena venus TaxID=2733690 RepID=A0A8H6YTC8_9AGAR|nr:hypothetical protein MVEN_00353000 [Mycena venus]
MATTVPAIRVYFEGSAQQYNAKRWNIPNHVEPFEPLPADVTCLVVPRTRSLFMNAHYGERLEISLDETKTWGLDDENDTALIFARARTPTSTFCLRMVLNTEKFIRHQRSNRYQVLDRLVKDAQFHSSHLADLQGQMVPIHYGMWLMNTGDWAGRVLFSITQWCGVSWNVLELTQMNTKANKILIGRTFEALHDFGVIYDDLSHVESFRHAIIDINSPGLSHEDLLNGKASCYITGFSKAHTNHRCMRRVPILPLGSFLSDEEVGCVETADVLAPLDFMKKENTDVSASEALEWYAKYSELYPDADNMDVLIAQRARLYPTVPSVCEGHLTVTFNGNDEYSRAIIRRTAPVDSAEEQELTPDSDPDLSPEPEALSTVVDRLEQATLEGSATTS